MAHSHIVGRRPVRHNDRFHGASLPDGIVILDIVQDSYAGFYLRDQATGSALSPTVVDALTERGLTDLLAPDAVGLLPDRPAWLDCDPDASARIRTRDVAIFLCALLRSSIQFHTSSFRTLVSRARHQPAPGRSLADYRSTLARFERMTLFLPFRMQCLFRSHFLLAVLRAYGLAADWVFGVSLFPFRAHCWIAVGDCLLGDRTDKVADFIPIFVIANTTGDAA
jgi:hypothetical protein